MKKYIASLLIVLQTTLFTSSRTIEYELDIKIYKNHNQSPDPDVYSHLFYSKINGTKAECQEKIEFLLNKALIDTMEDNFKYEGFEMELVNSPDSSIPQKKFIPQSLNTNDKIIVKAILQHLKDNLSNTIQNIQIQNFTYSTLAYDKNNPYIKAILKIRNTQAFTVKIIGDNLYNDKEFGLKSTLHFATKEDLNSWITSYLKKRPYLKKQLDEILATECYEGNFTIDARPQASALVPTLVCTAGACYYLYKNPDKLTSLWNGISSTLSNWYHKFI